MSEPFEILLAPVEVYHAPYGEAFPAVNIAPAGNWALVGTGGSLNRSPDGVRIAAGQTITDVRVDGSPFPVKKGREEENIVISMVMYDMTLEQLRLAFNANTVTTLAGPPARKEMSLERGALVTARAILIRFPSPYDDALNAQYQFYNCSFEGTSEITHRRTEPAGVSLEFHALVDTTRSAGDRVAKIVAQTA